MANESELRERFENAVDFSVADGTAITKGAVLKITDPRTAVLSDGDGDKVAGIAARDKVANDGRTRLAVFQNGVFSMKASGAVAVGMPVIAHSATGGDNMVAEGSSSNVGREVIGTALETAADTDNFQVNVNVGGA